jgi:hypothetical protein
MVYDQLLCPVLGSSVTDGSAQKLSATPTFLFAKHDRPGDRFILFSVITPFLLL